MLSALAADDTGEIEDCAVTWLALEYSFAKRFGFGKLLRPMMSHRALKIVPDLVVAHRHFGRKINPRVTERTLLRLSWPSRELFNFGILAKPSAQSHHDIDAHDFITVWGGR
jgi:hypothetical protein